MFNGYDSIPQPQPGVFVVETRKVKHPEPLGIAGPPNITGYIRGFRGWGDGESARGSCKGAVADVFGLFIVLWKNIL